MKPKFCDRKCVSKLMARTEKKFKRVDFWIPGGPTSMINFRTGKTYTGWPGMKFRVAKKKKDGSFSDKAWISHHFALTYCPVCGGSLEVKS